MLLYPVGLYRWLDMSNLVAYQEPIYQRYTSSLLWLYHPDPDHVLPQGQLLGPIHNAINWLLTLIGYAPFDQEMFFARVNLFCFLAMCATGFCVLLAINFILKQVRNPGVAILASGVALLPLIGSGSFGIWQLTKPDYEPYALVLYVICAGIVAHMASNSERAMSYGQCLIVGFLIAASLSEKITMAILPFTILLAIVLFSPSTLKSAGKILGIVASFAGSFSAIWWLQYFSISLAVAALKGIWGTVLNYGTDASTRMPWGRLLSYYADPSSSLSWTERVALAVPAFAIVLLALRPSRLNLRLAAILLPATAYYYWYLQARWVAATQFEYLSFAAFVACLGVLLAVAKWVEQVPREWTKVAGAVLGIGFAGLFVWTTYSHLRKVADPNGTNAAKNAWAIYQEIPGRQLFLFEADGGPAKIENVMLGSSNDIVPFVRGQRRDFVFARQNRRGLRLQDYDRVVFYFGGSIEEYRQQAMTVWAQKQNDYPFFDFSAFTVERAYPLREGPLPYQWSGVYVARERGAS